MSLSFLLLWLCPLVLGLWAYSSGKRDLHYPALLSWIMLAWLVPQAIYLNASSQGELYNAPFVYGYATACFLFTCAGFYLAKSPPPRRRRKPPLQFNEQRLLIATGGLVVVGIAALFMTIRTVNAQQLGASWTGIATAYYLLSNTAYYGIALAALMFARKPSVPLAIILGVALLGVMPAVMVLVKRTVLFELAVIAAGALYFVRRYSPPRPVVFTAMILGTLVLHQVGAMRNYIKAEEATVIEAIADGVLWEDFAYFEPREGHELTQATTDIYIAQQTNTYEWGAAYWNKLIHQYVPAFLLGESFKDALKIETMTGADDIAVEGYSSKGATRTGLSDSFRAFNIFGVMVFLMIGLVMGSLYGRALQGSLIAQFLYVILLNDAIGALTDSTARFIMQIPFLAVVSFCVFWFAKERKPAGRRRRAVPMPRPAARPRPAFRP